MRLNRFLILITFLSCKGTSQTQTTAFTGSPVESEMPIKIAKSDRFQLQAEKIVISNMEGLAARESYKIKYDNRDMRLSLYYKPREGVTEAAFLKFFNVKALSPGRTYFGMGSVYDIMLKDDPEVKKVRLLGGTARKYLSDWGSEISSDILAYHLSLPKHKFISEILIIFLDVVPREFEGQINAQVVETSLKNGDRRFAGYPAIETWLSHWTANATF